MMKKLFKIIVIIQLFTLLFSCTENEKFDGTPEDNNLVFETITGVVSTNATFALPGQTIDFTATIPQDFATMVNDTIDIEAVTSTIGGSLRKKSVRLLPGQSSVTDKILVGGGGGTFFMPVDLKLNAINIKNSFPGKQFLLKSNVITIESGDTRVPADSDNKLQIKVAWESLTTRNRIECKISRVGSVALSLKGSITSANPNPSSNVIKIDGTQYPISYNTDLNTTAENFVLLNSQDILNNNGIVVRNEGKALLFEYSTSTVPVITINNATGTNLGGFVFSSVTTGSGTLYTSREYLILNSQIASTSSSGLESALGSYNAGNYKISINAISLESTPNDLKYRIIIKKPNGETFVYNGVYNQMTTTSGFKDIFSFSKVGYGDSAIYSNFTQL